MTRTPALGPGDAPHADRAQLRRMAHALEGVFLNQLFQAMRATVHDPGLVAPSPGREMFEGLMDERMAQVAAERDTRGVGEALYRQLARRIPTAEPVAPAMPAGPREAR
jgi:Rod binding domain-containing protein